MNEEIRATEDVVATAPGHPEIVRIRAPNPGPMTLTGTNTYVVGESPAWVIDPGPADPEHIERVRGAAEERGGIAGVLLTHSHLDHVAGVEPLGAEVVVGTAAGIDEGAQLGAALGAVPDPPTPAPAPIEATRVGPFTVLPTPGHASDHVVLLYGAVCFCGDLILGEGSSIVPPAAGGGSLLDYMESLQVVAGLGVELLCPGHGPFIEDPGAKVASYVSHRRERERRLLAALDSGTRDRVELLEAAWSDVPEPMRPAASLAMQAHLEKLGAEGRLPEGIEGV